jgi:hypothetical protein
MQLGDKGILTAAQLETWNNTAGMMKIEVSVGGGRGSELNFKSLGVIDCYAKNPDDGRGASLLKHRVFRDPSLLPPNTTIVVKVTAVDANSREALDKFRDRFDKTELRASPQKVKLVGLSSC